MNPLKAIQAKMAVRARLLNGRIAFLPHAKLEMQKDDLLATDVVNTLRGGVVREAEWENGRWRYRAATKTMAVIFELIEPDRITVVTAWRFRK